MSKYGYTREQSLWRLAEEQREAKFPRHIQDGQRRMGRSGLSSFFGVDTNGAHVTASIVVDHGDGPETVRWSGKLDEWNAAVKEAVGRPIFPDDNWSPGPFELAAASS